MVRITVLEAKRCLLLAQQKS